MANPFTAFKFEASGTGVNTAIDMPDRLAYRKNVKNYGALGDGTGALLNTRYGSLAAAQAVYPFVTNIATQSIDWAAIMGAFHWNDSFLTTTATNQTASFTGAIASASFTGTISGNNLTTSAASGTIAIGQTISGMGVTACQIVSGSGTSWVVNGSSQAVGPVAMTTNCVLAVSSVSGNTIAFDGSNLVTGSGVVLSFIVSQFSGTAHGNGIYVLDRSSNTTSQAMVSISTTLTFASVPTSGIVGSTPLDLTNPGSLAFSPLVVSTTSTTVTFSFTSGVVNIGDSIAFINTNKGVIFIPPGNYVVSELLDIGPVPNIEVAFTGCTGASTVTGSFADYVFRKANSDAGSPSFVENLTVINNDANGGGIRLGGCEGAAIRNCTVVANRGINNSQDDSGSAGATSLEFTIENCTVSPGSNPTNSFGIMSVANGPIFNCRIIGYENGMVLWGQEGNQYIAGCYFEGNKVAFRPGFRPDGNPDLAVGYRLLGCSFKNNGTAIYASGSSGTYSGLSITADESVTVFGAIPQYGIQLLEASAIFGGVIVSGQYEVAAVSIDSATGTSFPFTRFYAVNAFNTSTHVGVAWVPPTTAQSALFQACNCPAPVYGLASLPVQQFGITAISWSSGTGLTTITVAGNIGNLTPPFEITVTGMSPSGYNGTFTVTTVIPNSQATWTQSNPGASSGTGSGIALVNLVNLGGAQEGDCYNVNDSSSATWGTIASAGGSTHAKVRWGAGAGTNWTVVGI